MRRAFASTTLWASKPQRVYKITTDQGTFTVKSDYLDYKQTVASLKQRGYTHINIACIGYDVTM